MQADDPSPLDGHRWSGRAAGEGARRALPTACWLLAWSLILTVGYHQNVLYTSNQYHYFLHGLAQAGLGDLRHDWLAQMTDPTPLFSGLVRVTYASVGPGFFYVEQFLLYLVYFAAMVRIYASLGKPGMKTPFLATFAAATVFLNSHLLADLSARYFGLDLRAFLQDGLAGQYLLGAYLQPSLFGVFLVLSIAAFVDGRPMQAAVLAAVASVWHVTYFLSALTLVGTYAAISLRKNPRTSAALLLVFLTMNLPTVVYTAVRFGPSSPSVARAAQDILANRRFPHHCVVARWFDLRSALKLQWVALAVYLVWGTRLAAVMTASIVVAALFTALQLLLGSDALALLFPWRPSVFLVPIATTVILGKLLWLLSRWRARCGDPDAAGPLGRAMPLVLFLFVAVNVAAPGAAATYAEFERKQRSDFNQLAAFVRDHSSAGQVFLVPTDTYADELPGFRLRTGMPVYVDYKSHPYKDVEVLEWFRRVEISRGIYRSWDRNAPIDAESLDALRKAGVNHVVLRRPLKLPPASGPALFANDTYTLVSLQAMLSSPGAAR